MVQYTDYLMRSSHEFQFAAHVENGKMVCYAYPPSMDGGKLATLLNFSSYGTNGAWQFLSDLEGFPLVVHAGPMVQAIEKLNEKLEKVCLFTKAPAFEAYMGRVHDIWTHLEEGGELDMIISPTLAMIPADVQPGLEGV